MTADTDYYTGNPAINITSKCENYVGFAKQARKDRATEAMKYMLAKAFVASTEDHLESCEDTNADADQLLNDFFYEIAQHTGDMFWQHEKAKIIELIRENARSFVENNELGSF